MYAGVLLLHSWLRWAVLLAALVVLVRSLSGWATGRGWSRGDDGAGSAFVGILDVQMLLGLLLYGWLSPITWAAFADLGGAMRQPMLRFWAVEHVFGMVAAIVVAHVGRTRLRHATTDRQRHRITAISVGIAVLLVLATIPWPFMPYARPLFRW